MRCLVRDSDDHRALCSNFVVQLIHIKYVVGCVVQKAAVLTRRGSRSDDGRSSKCINNRRTEGQCICDRRRRCKARF